MGSWIALRPPAAPAEVVTAPPEPRPPHPAVTKHATSPTKHPTMRTQRILTVCTPKAEFAETSITRPMMRPTQPRPLPGPDAHPERLHFPAHGAGHCEGRRSAPAVHRPARDVRREGQGSVTNSTLPSQVTGCAQIVEDPAWVPGARREAVTLFPHLRPSRWRPQPARAAVEKAGRCSDGRPPRPYSGPALLTLVPRSSGRQRYAVSSAANSRRASVWASTSDSVVAGDIRAIMWNGVIRMPRFSM